MQYINDLPQVLSNYNCNLYADDTAITITGTKPEEIEMGITNVLATVAPWFRYNRLSLNCSKTQFMIFGTRNSCANITFDHVAFEGNVISRASKVKYLGIQLDPLLSFNAHIDYVKRKTIGKVKLLGRLNEFLSKETLLMLYKTLILPIIDYGDIIYDGLNQKDAEVLQKVQNMAFKSILRVPKRTSTTETHSELNMLTLSQRRTLHLSKQMYKIDKGLGPPKLLSRFTRRSEISKFQTRSVTGNEFEIPRNRLKQTDRNPVYRGIKVWETIPDILKAAEDVDLFVSNTKQWLVHGDVGIT